MKTVGTTLYFHPRIRDWLERQSRFNNESLNTYMRRVFRDHIQDVDPDGWKEIAEALRSEAEEGTTEATG